MQVLKKKIIKFPLKNEKVKLIFEPTYIHCAGIGKKIENCAGLLSYMH